MAEWIDPGTNKTFSFNEDGKFVDENGNPPQNGFRNDQKFSDWLHSYVQKEMVARDLKITRVDGVPIFHSKNAFNSPNKLLVLNCGSGRIMAGLWSVGLVAWHGLKAGSVLYYIDECFKRGMEVIVLNPNFSEFSDNVTKVYNELIIPGNPKHVYIICHSMGGYDTIRAIHCNPEWAINHIRAIAMTDAIEMRIDNDEYQIDKWSHQIAINWIRSNKELNEELGEGDFSMLRSAGTNDHPLTTWHAYPYIWEFFNSKGADSEPSALDLNLFTNKDINQE